MKNTPIEREGLEKIFEKKLDGKITEDEVWEAVFELPIADFIFPSGSSPLSVIKNNYITNPKRTDIETPAEVSRFIYGLFPNVQKVFDPCYGKKSLMIPFMKAGISVSGCEIKYGNDFLKRTKPITADLILCNPPFNLGVGKRLGSEIFLEKILELRTNKAPIVLFAPMGFRLNQKKTSKRWKWLRDNCPEISSIISLPLDVYDNVLFHS